MCRRFGVFQKDKWRPVDDATESGVNDATGFIEKLTLIGADAITHTVQAFEQERAAWESRLREQGRWASDSGSAVPGTPDAVEVGLDDVGKAFRTIPSAEPGFMAVAVYNPVTLRAELLLIPSFVFGTLSAVVAWNRVSTLYAHVGRRVAAVPSLEYFDDFPTVSPAYDRGSAQMSLGVLFNRMGPGFAAKKHVPSDQIAVCLGVQSDCSRVPLDAHVSVSVTDERRKKLAALIREILQSRYITHAAARSLFGKARFVCCPCFGRVGLALLQPLQKIYSNTHIAVNSDLETAMLALVQIIMVLKPVRIPLRTRAGERPLIILTDASFSGMTGRIGVVVFCPYRCQYWYTSKQAPKYLICLLQYYELKKTYICQLELIAAVCAYLTFPDVIRGRLVHHFVDNDPAKSNLVSGYSSHPDSARIIHEYHMQVVILACQPWIGFVYSEDNISDLPSRNAFKLMRQLKAVRRDCVLPDLSAWRLRV